MTPLRRLLIQSVAEYGKPIPANQLLNLLEKEGLSPNKTSVYRQLDTLQEYGVIQEVFIEPNQRYFEISSHHHHHFVCGTCHEIQPVHSNELETLFSKLEAELEQRGLFVKKHELAFLGSCSACHS